MHYSLENNPIISNLKPCKPSLVLIIITTFLFLPSIIASLIFMSFSLFLFIPIICILLATSLLHWVTSMVRIEYIGRVLIEKGAALVMFVRATPSERHDGGLGLSSVPDCIEFDGSEAPLFDESSSSSSPLSLSLLQDDECGIGGFMESHKERINQDKLDCKAWDHIGRDGEYKRYHEILSYWRRKEKGDRVKKKADQGSMDAILEGL